MLHCVLPQASSLPADVDVVVVGAGAAGLAAALRAHKAGLSVVLLEASDGVGGRMRTDTVCTACTALYCVLPAGLQSVLPAGVWGGASRAASEQRSIRTKISGASDLFTATHNVRTCTGQLVWAHRGQQMCTAVYTSVQAP